MADPIDLEVRIRRARDWAQERIDEDFGEDPDDPATSLAKAIDAAAFRAVVQVLDQVLGPDFVSNEE